MDREKQEENIVYTVYKDNLDHGKNNPGDYSDIGGEAGVCAGSAAGAPVPVPEAGPDHRLLRAGGAQPPHQPLQQADRSTKERKKAFWNILKKIHKYSEREREREKEREGSQKAL